MVGQAEAAQVVGLGEDREVRKHNGSRITRGITIWSNKADFQEGNRFKQVASTPTPSRGGPTLGLLKLRGLRAAGISLNAREDSVIVEEFGEIYLLFKLWQPRIRNASVKIGNQISHKSSVFPFTLA
jgi:hypothetical protein